jgi:hypothetical protein
MGTLTKTYRCTKEFKKDKDNNYDDNMILKECLLSTNDINIVEHISKGAIFKGLYKKKDVIIKKIIENGQNYNDLIDKILFEIEYSYVMGEFNISPYVYDAFYFIGDREVIGYIVMDAMKTSIYHAIRAGKYSTNDYIKMFTEEIKILHKQIFDHHLYCTDIKPENFVFKKEGNEFIVRSIDFGKDFCWLDQLPFIYVNVELYYVICLIQLLLLTAYYIERRKVYIEAVRPFFEDLLFRKHMENDINDIHPNITDIMRNILNARFNNDIFRFYTAVASFGLNPNLETEILIKLILNRIYEIAEKLNVPLAKKRLESSGADKQQGRLRKRLSLKKS